MSYSGTQENFNYGAGAELFPPRRPSQTGLRSLSYKRFLAASEAIQFAMETLPPAILRNTFLQVDDDRYDHLDIRRLYESLEYPNLRNGRSGPSWLPRPVARNMCARLVAAPAIDHSPAERQRR
jgi:hypothetical protein